MTSTIDDTGTVHRHPLPPPDKYPKMSELVTMDIIYSRLGPDITPQRLSRTPDDQLLFFWCERAYLYLEKPSHGVTNITVQDEEGTTMEWIYQLSALDKLDGRWETFEDPHPKGGDNNQKKERMKAEFVAIASYPSGDPNVIPWQKKLNKSLILFLIKRREGIAYRVAVVQHVPLRKWMRCKPERVLVALG